MKRGVHLRFALPLALLCTVAGCHPLRASLNETSPPSFNFSSGFSECCDSLIFFIVQEVPPENQNIHWLRSGELPKQNIVLWQIWVQPDNSGRAPSVITYGEVPPGFVQKIPEVGAPPVLIEGKVYDAYGPPSVVPETYIRFTIRDGKPVQLPVPGKD